MCIQNTGSLETMWTDPDPTDTHKSWPNSNRCNVFKALGPR